jgi:hypothetical protein
MLAMARLVDGQAGLLVVHEKLQRGHKAIDFLRGPVLLIAETGTRRDNPTLVMVSTCSRVPGWG